MSGKLSLNSFLFLILTWSMLISQIYCLQHELNVLIEPGHRECFHQYLTRDLTMETEYQVVQGGELDISYWISTPSNRVIFTELRKPGGQHQFRTDEIGEYKFCFDNSFSRFARKQVFFFLGTNDKFIDPNFQVQNVFDSINNQIGRDQLGELDNKLESFREAFHRVQVNMEKAQRMQNMFRAYEVIDRNVMEHNYDRVNFWSTLNISLMVLVGIIQVYMIRSLFEDRSKLGKVLRGGTEKKSFT
jgi:p24 family protein gamma-2